MNKSDKKRTVGSDVDQATSMDASTAATFTSPATAIAAVAGPRRRVAALDPLAEHLDKLGQANLFPAQRHTAFNIE
jgi:hypothetical protein